MEAQDLFKRGHFSRLPKTILMRWKDLAYLLTPECSIVNRSHLIAWGKKVLKKDRTLSHDAFTDVVEDLCETRDVAIGVAIDYAAEAVAQGGNPNR